ncbi:hypothetical protein GO613_14735 [Azoarcus communis]|jgi:hypothetical protein|uniref:DUF6129 domain-containing protein n=1 Tax=Parazoarcus communis SWub3 = DSM 12120 TaxID=1121029 RepID=A0A323UY53_9RHOO|nr:DUF6129 family protein [Parazoarcus communis]NMG49351.1 hypothetical protein [Parazoarcus communis]NMG69429.1 hypothetical protein [Parazoarcus communis SWub3 = DSM 12120]PZA17375.1 hypothetical protein DNK49_05795 [Azoarcus communis] [Parazoarcus communis SWub3 = DSM 12120]
MITTDMLDEAAVIAAATSLGDDCVTALRAKWPAMRFVVCSEDDIPARLSPALEAKGFNLYLIGGGDHCLALTKELDAAIGIVVASVVED